MGREGHRQPDPSEDLCEETTNLNDENNDEKICIHLNQTINVSQFKKGLCKYLKSKECHMCQNNPIEKNDNEDDLESGPPQLWICLQCAHLGCGRSQGQHAIAHFNTPHSDSHDVVMDIEAHSLWCYKCNDDVTNRMNNSSKAKVKSVIDIMKKKRKTGPLKIETSNNNQAPSPSSIANNEISKRQNKIVGFHEKKPLPADCLNVRGLTNLGNTCFFNSVLQCLAQTPYLITVLEELMAPGQRFELPGGKLKANDDDIEMAPIEGELQGNFHFTSVLLQTLKEMTSNKDRRVYRPSDLLAQLRKKNGQYNDGGQHDSHELLRLLVEAVRSEDVKRYQAVILEKLGLRKSNPSNVDPAKKSQLRFYADKLIDKLLGTDRVFKGMLISTLECLVCHHTSSTQETFMDLSLSIASEKPQPPSYNKRKSYIHQDASEALNRSVTNSARNYQNKKERLADNRKHKMKRNSNNDSINNSECSKNEKISNESKSADERNAEGSESDADVEDNTEDEGCSIPEVGESGYGSEKPSTVTSPVSSAEFPSERNINTAQLNDLPSDNKLQLLLDGGHNSDHANGGNSNVFNSPSPVDVSSNDWISVKYERGEIGQFTFSNSSIINSDLTSPEGPTVSPLSSPITSKDSPTSLASIIVDSDTLDKFDRVLPKLDTVDSQAHSDIEDSSKKSIPELETDEHNLTQGQERDNSLNVSVNNCGQHEMCKVTENLSKIEIASNLPSRYRIESGECSILSCLNNFTQAELMKGNNKVHCSACTEKANKGKEEAQKVQVSQPSTKQYLVSRIPAVLILQIKRFQAQGPYFRKVKDSVKFPVLLDLSPICKGLRRKRIYALYGIVEHSGTMLGGHYVAYVKARAAIKPDDPRWAFLPRNDRSYDDDNSENMTNDSNKEFDNEEASATSAPTNIEPPPGRWYEISDSSVYEITEEEVLKKEAYLLFYERIL